MHGVRQADVRIGERVAVIGLGLVGQLTGQILRAAGCHVVGIDLSRASSSRRRGSCARSTSVTTADARPAPRSGAAPPTATRSIVTAATHSSDPIELAATLLRDRGRVVVVGDVHVEVPRGPVLRARDRDPLSRAPTGRVGTTASTRNEASTIQSATSGGPSNATWRVPRSGGDRTNRRRGSHPGADAGRATQRRPMSAARRRTLSPLGIVLEYGPTELHLPRRASGPRTTAPAPSVPG